MESLSTTETDITKNAPQLRFPEFYDEWEQQELGDKSTFSKGKSISKKDIIDEGIHLCIRYGELYTTYNEIIKKDKVVSKTNLDIKNLVLSNKNDVIIPSSGETQLDIATASCVIDSDIILGGDLNIIRTKHNGIFIAYYLNNKKKKDIAKLSQGNSVVHLYNKNLSELNVNIPSALEQQKIANFLTQVDQKIELLEKQQAALEQYKKGIMQKIFNQEIRFKIENQTGELVEPPEWEEKKLGDIGEVFNGLTGKTKEDFGQGYPFIQYKQIFDSSKIDTTKCNYVDLSDNEKQREVKFGDAFFTVSSETPDEIGTSSILLNDVKKMYLNSFCFGYRMNKEELLPEFARYLFRSNYFRKKIIPLAQGSTRFNMSKNNFVKLIVNLPNVKEQHKIANFLSAIDTKIEAVAERSRSHCEWKKGLLQKMFV